jgi:outer membrane protein TolC
MVTAADRPRPAALLFLTFGLACAASAGALAQERLTLDDAMRRARDGTVEARALASGLDEAGARVREAQAGFWPSVDVTETVQRGNHPVFAFSSLLAQRRFREADFALASLNHPEPVTNTRTAVSVEQPVVDAGRTALRVQAARLGRDLADATRAAQAFVRVLQLEAVVQATDAAVEAAESDRQRTLTRRDAGLVTEADALAMDVYLADVRQRQIAAAGDLSVARVQLADAIGAPLGAAIVPIRPASLPAAAAASEALVRDAVAAHPQRRRAEVERQLADNARRAARAGLLPTVGVQAGWEFNGATLGAQRSSWAVGADVRLNLFRGFADSARIAAATHAQSRAAAEQERVGRQIEVGVRAAMAQLATARAREAAGRAALVQARESQRIIRDRYDSGLATVTDVLRAAEASLDAASRSTTTEMDVILQTVALDRALGRL